jgi:hypothetical protein
MAPIPGIVARIDQSGFGVGSMTLGGEVTVEAWVYHSGVFDSWVHLMEMAANSVNSFDSMRFCLSESNSGKPSIEVWRGPRQAILTAFDPIPQETWTHVA